MSSETYKFPLRGQVGKGEAFMAAPLASLCGHRGSRRTRHEPVKVEAAASTLRRYQTFTECPYQPSSETLPEGTPFHNGAPVFDRPSLGKLKVSKGFGFTELHASLSSYQTVAALCRPLNLALPLKRKRTPSIGRLVVPRHSTCKHHGHVQLTTDHGVHDHIDRLVDANRHWKRGRRCSWLALVRGIGQKHREPERQEQRPAMADSSHTRNIQAYDQRGLSVSCW